MGGVGGQEECGSRPGPAFKLRAGLSPWPGRAVPGCVCQGEGGCGGVFCAEMYNNVLNCPLMYIDVLNSIVQKCTERYIIVQKCTDLYRNKVYRNVQECTGMYNTVCKCTDIISVHI